MAKNKKVGYYCKGDYLGKKKSDALLCLEHDSYYYGGKVFFSYRSGEMKEVDIYSSTFSILPEDIEGCWVCGNLSMSSIEGGCWVCGQTHPDNFC